MMTLVNVHFFNISFKISAQFSQILVFPANETEKLEEGDTEPAEPVVARIPLTPLALQEYGSGSKSEGGDDSTGTPRKRRTWGAPECNPLMLTPTVVTRLNRIQSSSL